MRRMVWAGIILCLLFCFGGCGAAENPVQMNKSINESYIAKTKISDVTADPVFENYGRLIFPSREMVSRWRDGFQKKRADNYSVLSQKKTYNEDYETCADRAKNELDNEIRPELSSHIDADIMAQYDIIYLGFPKMEYRFNCVSYI